ncbi:MAG: DUF748 domain-containing protein [Candidatus Omnitrophica bacterium]|nr:DUF748 domain-containing protein [Candidatus Omnitrophota bacterium]
MKTKFKVIIWVFAVLLVIFLVASILTAVYAPRIVEQQIEQNLKVKTSLRKISLSPPFTITLEGLEIGDFASIKKVALSPNLIGLLFGKIVIHGLNVVEPVINLVQSADGKLNLPVLEQKGKPPAVYLTSLRVQNGKVIFTDRKVIPEGFQVVVDKLNVKVAKVALPVTSLATNFKISAELVNSQGKAFGNIVFGGWLDYLAKGMDAKLEVKDLDVVNLSPYYGNFISSKKLAQAMLDLNSAFKAKNNALEIITNFNLSKMVYEKTEEQQLPELNLVQDALDFFTDADGNLKLEFKIDTTLDNPALSQEKIRKIILKAAAKNLSRQSPEQLVDKVTNAINKYKDLGKELKSIFGK